MENLNELPSTPTRLDDQAKVLLHNLLSANQGITDLRGQNNNNVENNNTTTLAQTKPPKSSTKTRLKRSWIPIIIISVLYFFFSIKFLDMMLSKKKFFANQPMRIGLTKFILFTILIILVFMVPFSS